MTKKKTDAESVKATDTEKKTSTKKSASKKTSKKAEVAEAVAEEKPTECVAHYTHPMMLKGRRVTVTDTRIVLKKGDKYFTLEGEPYDNPSAVITERRPK